MKNRNRLFWMAIVALVIVPLIVLNNTAFMGTDDGAVATIQNIDKSYTPWFGGFKLFKSDEIKSLFFCLQAAIGAGVLGYYFGYYKGKESNKKA